MNFQVGRVFVAPRAGRIVGQNRGVQRPVQRRAGPVPQPTQPPKRGRMDAMDQPDALGPSERKGYSPGRAV